MTELTAEEQARVRLYRTVFFALHRHDPEREGGAGVYLGILLLAEMLRSKNHEIIPLAEEIMAYLESARTARTSTTSAGP